MAIKPFAICVCLSFSGCVGNSPPQAQSASRSASYGSATADAGVSANAQSGTTEGDDLKTEFVAVDRRLEELAKKVDAARDDAKTDLTRQLDELQKRDDELKVQLRTAEARVGADAEKARREVHGAIVELKKRLERVADRIQR